MKMPRKLPLLIVAGAAAWLAPAIAQQPNALAQTQPGLWEVSGIPGTKAPIRQCIANVALLARFEHRSNNCRAKVLKSDGTHESIEYSCPGAGFGHSDIDVLTPRSLRINTQGISYGLPFGYVLQARRVDDCPKSPVVTHH
jgi:hypothetical protein